MIFGLLKPEYLYRPSQLLARITRGKPKGFTDVSLPWGKSIRVSADDNVGSQIATLGLYDLVITETLWRLCEEGETALDVGANIGYTTFVMAQRLGAGSLKCYEPHPIIYQELLRNVASLREQGCLTKISTFQKALGPVAGELPLHVPQDFTYHRGESSLADIHHLDCRAEPIMVPVETLDSQLKDDEKIGVMKIDVEGFELDVLQGAKNAFANRRIRDCVFEEHKPYPNPVSNWFESHGYQVFRLDRSFSRPRLLAPDSPVPKTAWTATNYLATMDQSRVQQRFSKPRWGCLGKR